MGFLSITGEDLGRIPRWILAVCAAVAVLLVVYQMMRGEALICANGAIFAKSCLTPKAPLEIPEGAVVSFELKVCPDGWEEYEKAYGAFVRGVDRGGKQGREVRDPDGERVPGDIQGSAFEQHTHEYSGHGADGMTDADAGGDRRGLWHGGDFRQSGTKETTSSGEGETRPVNIALLFCEKIVTGTP